jgi:hypothetical protein
MLHTIPLSAFIYKGFVRFDQYYVMITVLFRTAADGARCAA